MRWVRGISRCVRLRQRCPSSPNCCPRLVSRSSSRFLRHAGWRLLSADHLFALEETLELMCDTEQLERIKAGEQALVSGNFVSQGEFEQQMGISTRTMPTRWRLVVSGPARRAILGLPIETSRPRVVDFLTGDLLESPGTVGVELEGHLSRRYVASVADQRIIYRLDPTNRAVRVVDVQLRPARLRLAVKRRGEARTGRAPRPACDRRRHSCARRDARPGLRRRPGRELHVSERRESVHEPSNDSSRSS